MKTTVMYEADDGTKFTTEESCLFYENELRNLREANEMLDNGANLLDVLTVANRQNPHRLSIGLNMEDRYLLSNITKDTKLIVSHFQCSEKPLYKPTWINKQGNVFIRADSDPKYGSYGNYVSLTDLLIHARYTFLYLSNNK